ncbi:MAG: FAD-dependent oxidoreductase, partial [archaeon]
MNSHVVIIGAGIGGLALAARLAHDGYRVDVFEKNTFPGGRVAQKKIKGYTIDVGPTFLLMPREFEELFSYCGESFSDAVELERLSPLYRLHYTGMKHLDVHDSLPLMRKSFYEWDAIHAEKNTQGFIDFLSHEQEKYPRIYEKFIAKPARSVASLLFSPDVLELFRLDGFSSMWENISTYFDD